MAAAPSDLQILRDRYAFQRELGRGGMATVYLARDLLHDSLVAVKVLRADLVPLLGAERFAREIRITSRLHHPNILPVLDSGEADGVPFYVTPYIQGESLAQRLKREGQLPIPDAVAVARDIVAALEVAHAQQYVHRDIKPSNILLADGRAILADFGIARALDVVTAEKLTESGVTLGTPAYMSPEQSACGIIDGRSDIYSLGCVVYEMIAGAPPFGGATAQSVRARHAADPPPSLRTVRTTVTPELEAVIDRALAKVPADRFADASAFAEALIESARGSAPWPRLRWSPRIVLAATVIAVAVAGFWSLDRSRERTLDPNKVIVFPLVQRAGEEARSGLGEEVALLIGTALEHTEPLRWIDGWTWLDSRRRTDVALLDARTARDIARARRARYYIDGALLGSADSSTVILRLNDASGDSLVTQASASGPSGEAVARLGLTAVSELLPRLLAPGRRVDFAPLSERRPAAIANWLQGEREYRQSQFTRALDYYARAIEEDSALAVAAVKGAQAADWMGLEDDARTFVAAALSHEGSLPLKYAHLTRGLESSLNGVADTAVARYRLALGLDPAWAEAWTALGDAYYHLLPSESPLDSLAEAAFEEARAADPEFLPPRFHLTEIAIRRGEWPRAASLLAHFRRFTPDTTWTVQLELMASCRRNGPAAIDWPAEVARHSEEVFYTGKALAAAGADWGCAEAALGALLSSDSMAANYQRASLLILQNILVAQGRYPEAGRLISSAVARGVTGAKGLFVLDAVAGAPFRREAEEALDHLADGTRTLEGPRLWFLGNWYARTGSVSRLAEVVEQLEERGLVSGKPDDRLLADVMAARLDLTRGDTARARDRLLALRPTATRTYITWGLWQSLAAERMALAEILLTGGDPARAIEVASAFDHFEPAVFVLYIPRSLALRHRAAVRLGRTDLVERYAARLEKIGRRDLLAGSAVAVQTPTRRAP